MRLFVLLPVLLLAGCSSTKIINTPIAETKVPMGASVLAVGHPNGKIVFGGGSVAVANWQGVTCLLTAWHIVDKGNQSITVTGSGITRFYGPFRRIGNDLAFCKIDHVPTEWRALEVATRLDLGPVVAWGYPSAEGRLSAKEGTVVRIGATHMKVEGIALPGMSGGPVLQNNKIVGVVSLTQFLKGKEIHFAALLPRKIP